MVALEGLENAIEPNIIIGGKRDAPVGLNADDSLSYGPTEFGVMVKDEFARTGSCGDQRAGAAAGTCSGIVPGKVKPPDASFLATVLGMRR